MIPSDANRQVVEYLSPGLNRVWRLDTILYHARSPFQDILIGMGAQGVGLFCDSARQSTEYSQLAYHEAQVIPALLLAPQHDSVLVIGSTEGVVCQLALQAGARRVVHVDVDDQCLAACADWLPYGYTPDELRRARNHDGPIELHVQDGARFVEEAVATGVLFDVVTIDLPDEDPQGAGQQNRLYTDHFLKSVSALLRPGGVVITQAGNSCMWRRQTLVRAWCRARGVFPCVVYFESDEHDWSWIVASKAPCDDAPARMIDKLARLAYRPWHIDALSLERSTRVPKALRDAARENQP
jgi:spermidine synthase